MRARRALIVMGESFRFRSWHGAAFLAAVSALSAVSASSDARAYWRGVGRAGKGAPAWVYPAVWTGLNGLQVWADLRILNNHTAPERRALVGLRAASWLLHGLFTPAFLRARSQVAGEAATLAEGLTAGATLALLVRSDPIAALAVAPLTLWTACAGLLGRPRGSADPDQLVDQLRWRGAF